MKAQKKKTYTFGGKEYNVFTFKDQWGSRNNIILEAGAYGHGGTLGIEAYGIDGGYPEPWSTLTVNLMNPLQDNVHAFADTNNNPWLEEFLKANGLAEPTGISARSGFCTYPLYKWNTGKFTA